MTKQLTNTERLIRDFEATQRTGGTKMHFMVGKYTGNGAAVVEALRRRGYTVESEGYKRGYTITAAPACE